MKHFTLLIIGVFFSLLTNSVDAASRNAFALGRAATGAGITVDAAAVGALLGSSPRGEGSLRRNVRIHAQVRNIHTPGARYPSKAIENLRLGATTVPWRHDSSPAALVISPRGLTNRPVSETVKPHASKGITRK